MLVIDLADHESPLPVTIAEQSLCQLRKLEQIDGFSENYRIVAEGRLHFLIRIRADSLMKFRQCAEKQPTGIWGCRNNGMLEEWEEHFLYFTQYSNVPLFHLFILHPFRAHLFEFE